MATRATARAALAALFVTAGGFTTVNAFAPLDLKGTTKVLNIYTRASSLEVRSAHLKKDFHIFYLDTFVKRRGTVADEDDLDALHEIITTVCKANPTNANWEHLELDEESQGLFSEVAGIQYRMERHRVKVKLSG
jgi:hypothetical protein